MRFVPFVSVPTLPKNCRDHSAIFVLSAPIGDGLHERDVVSSWMFGCQILGLAVPIMLSFLILLGDKYSDRFAIER